jgi:alpha-ribazole phosphatase
MAQLWLVRHAQPVVAQGVCYGALDVAACPQATALAATALAAAALAQSLPHGAHVVTSPLQRCELLAQCLQGLRPDLAYKTALDLREMDFGSWEGQRWDAITPPALQAWTDDFENYACGATGESAGQFVRRVQRAAATCMANWPADAASPAPTVWISHAGVARAMVWLHQRGRLDWRDWADQRLCQPLGLRASEWPADAPGFGQVLRLDWPAPPPAD